MVHQDSLIAWPELSIPCDPLNDVIRHVLAAHPAICWINDPAQVDRIRQAAVVYGLFAWTRSRTSNPVLHVIESPVQLGTAWRFPADFGADEERRFKRDADRFVREFHKGEFGRTLKCFGLMPIEAARRALTEYMDDADPRTTH